MMKAHKCILAWKSDVFGQQFQNTIKSSDEIIMSGVSADAFKDFLRLFYVRFDVNFFSIAEKIADQHIDPILSIAETHKVHSTIKSYNSHLLKTINEQNVIFQFELARKHLLDELKTKCIDLMKQKGEQIITSEAFMECSQENLKSILELGIWNDKKCLIGAGIKWAKNYCKENQLDAAISYDLRTALGDAFELIPFSTMDPMEFFDFQCDYADLFTVDEIKKLAKQIADRRNMKQI